MAPSNGFIRAISPLPSSKDDPKHKRYTVNIERALALWDSVEEWADYISFLGKLHKALKSSSFQQIPCSRLVASRLAQCLHPSLPSGVHQKALQVYESLFQQIGDDLANQITLWIPGLLPVMSYASINAKPLLIEIFRTFILTLPDIRNLTRPLLLSLLPGIDDESSESFEDVLKLIDDIKLKVNDDAHFWQCFFLTTISSTDRRTGALVWAIRRLPKFLEVHPRDEIDMESKDPVTGFQALSYDAQTAVIPEPGLLIRAFCKGLMDEQLLVQRGFLDLLVKNIELQSPALTVLTPPKDLELLLVSACSTVLRRDMSLNRRLWNWLLGPDPQSRRHSTTGNSITNTFPEQSPSHISRSEYFSKYARQPLVTGLLKLINADPKDPAERTRPYKICLSIMDRWEIGGSVVPDVLIPVVKSVQRYDRANLSDDHYAEVVRSAGAFFDGVEAVHIWHDCLQLILDPNDDNLQLFLFIIATFNVREEEMLVHHLPIILLALLSQGVSSNYELWFQVADAVFDLIPSRAFLPIQHATDGDDELLEDSIIEKIISYYQHSPDDVVPIPFPPATLSLLILKRASSLTASAIRTRDHYVGPLCRLLCHLLRKIPEQEQWRDDEIISELCQVKSTEDLGQGFVHGLAELLSTIYQGLEDHEIDLLTLTSIQLLWKPLSSISYANKVEAVRDLWTLQTASSDRRVEAAVASLLVDQSVSLQDKGRAFSTLWQQSIDRANCDVILTRCLFIMLDELQMSQPEYTGSPGTLIVQSWLESVATSSSLNRFFRLLIMPVITNVPARTSRDSIDINIFTYHMNCLTAVFRAVPSLRTMAGKEYVPLDDFDADSQFQPQISEQFTYAQFARQAAFSLFRFTPFSPELLDSYSSALKASVEFLDLVLEPREADLVDLIGVLMAVLSDSQLMKDDLYSLSQIRILNLFSKVLKEFSLVSASVSADSAATSPTIPQKSTSKSGAGSSNGSSTNDLGTPKNLIQCLINGLSYNPNELVIEAWVRLLVDCLPLFEDAILQLLIPLVECLCQQISKSFEIIRNSLDDPQDSASVVDPCCLFSYLTGLERLLTAAHKHLGHEESRMGSAGRISAGAEAGGFFGAVMAGVFAVESPLARSAAANNRLTVLLSFQDAIKVGYNIWRWTDRVKPLGSSKDSTVNLSTKLKFKTRKLLETIYTLETLETLETFIGIGGQSSSVFKVIHALDGSRPKLTVPFIFNAIISRINPSSLEAGERSTLTTDLTDRELTGFLVEYLKSLENDAVEEIWFECMGFVREVQNNQSYYRPVIPNVMKFAAVMAEKVDGVNFGDQKRIRKDLADVFLRLLNSALVAKGVLEDREKVEEDKELKEKEKEKVRDEQEEKQPLSSPQQPSPSTTMPSSKFFDLSSAIVEILPSIRAVLVDNDKVQSALSNITTNLIMPVVKAKSFPQSFSPSHMSLLRAVMNVGQSQRVWKGLVGDTFLDQRFLSQSVSEARVWMPLIQRWANNDNERLQDYIARLSTHGSNSNVLFGWSEQEATIKQTNLLRMALLIMSGDSDGFLLDFRSIVSKIQDFFNSTGPDAHLIRSAGMTCLRAIVLKIDRTHLSTIWTFVYTALEAILDSLLVTDVNQEDPVLITTVYSACKLLDTLLVVCPEDFQPHEWLFICDNMDAIFKRSDQVHTGVIDRISLSGTLQATGVSSKRPIAYVIY